MKRKLLIASFSVLLLIAIVGVFAVPWHGLTTAERWREMHSGRIYFRGSSHKRAVALTFDDGPDVRYTPDILKTLKNEHVHATFFVCGKMLAAHPELGIQIVHEGHVIGNHTDTHPHLERETNPDVARELNRCEDRIESITGERTYLFRPPRGLWNKTVFDDAKAHGYNIILWSLAFDRSSIHYSPDLRKRVVKLAKPGDIILLHDGSNSKKDERGATTKELSAVIHGLKKRGFAFLTVPEMLHIRGDQPVPFQSDRK